MAHLTVDRLTVRVRIESAIWRYVDLEEDSPELAQLFTAIDGPCTGYSPEEMRSIVERIIREEKPT